MTANEYRTTDFVVDRGDSLTIELGPITVTDKDGVRQPVDTTTVDELLLTIKSSVSDADPGLYQATIGSGVDVNTPSTSVKNYATAFVPSTVLDTFATRVELVWDAEIKVDARRETIARGRITVVPDVTRA